MVLANESEVRERAEREAHHKAYLAVGMLPGFHNNPNAKKVFWDTYYEVYCEAFIDARLEIGIEVDDLEESSN